MLTPPGSPPRIVDLSGPCEVIECAHDAADQPDDVASQAALQLISAQAALCKTVKNGDWLRLVANLAHPPAIGFRTSFSLIPPTGRMHLYGQLHSQCAGLLFDRSALDLSSAVCFPSGYFAKTEQHLQVDPSGEVQLTGGRAAHATTVDALLATGAALVGDDGEPPLYNELSICLHDVAGLRAVFVRTSSPEDTLFAMGLQSLLEHVFPELPLLPLLRIPGTEPPSIVTRQEQLHLLRRHASAASLHGAGVGGVGGVGGAAAHALVAAPSPMGGRIPRLPVDALAFPELSLGERLALHSAHGIDQASLRAAFDEIVRSEGASSLAPHVVRCLCAAALADNVASARAIVRTAAPLLLAPLLVSTDTANDTTWFRRPDAGGADSTAGGAGADTSGGGGGVGGEHEASGGDRGGGDRGGGDRGGGDRGGAVACRRSMLESVTTLQRACSAERSEGMLVALGAQITISEFVAGRTAQRLEKACGWLEDWCRRAEPGACSPAALVFLLTSWMEARKVDGNSDWVSFLSGKAVSNRLAFHGELTRLLDAQRQGDGVEYIEQLYKLSSKLRKPCLRLRILQQVLGLDTRFSRDIVHGVICLAFDVLEQLGGKAKRPTPTPTAAAAATTKAAAAGATVVAAATPLESPSSPSLSVASSSGTIDASSGSSGSSSHESAGALNLDGYDEATRLEADALLGSGVSRRPSDPIGDQSRRGRVMYYYR